MMVSPGCTNTLVSAHSRAFLVIFLLESIATTTFSKNLETPPPFTALEETLE